MVAFWYQNLSLHARMHCCFFYCWHAPEINVDLD